MKNNKRTTLKIIYEVCNELGILCESFCDDWVLRLTKDNVKKYVYGYDVGLNTDSQSKILKDKAALSELMIDEGISCVEHILFPMPITLSYLNKDYEYYEKILYDLIDDYVVIKPNQGSSGIDVYKTNSILDAKKILNKIYSYGNACISKYYEVETEYRVIVFNGNIRICYEKCTDNWIHNLSNGAIPKNVMYDDEIKKIVKKIYKIIGAPIMAIDIIYADGKMLILEINGGLMVDRFAVNYENYVMAKELYKDCIIQLFD